jgi:hypothetical protein
MHQYQVAVHPHPAKPDPPLKLHAPKPTFVNTKQNSAFGFKSRTPADDSDVDMEENLEEGVESAEEFLVEEIYKRNKNIGKRHTLYPYLIIVPTHICY